MLCCVVLCSYVIWGVCQVVLHTLCYVVLCCAVMWWDEMCGAPLVCMAGIFCAPVSHNIPLASILMQDQSCENQAGDLTEKAADKETLLAWRFVQSCEDHHSCWNRGTLTGAEPSFSKLYINFSHPNSVYVKDQNQRSCSLFFQTDIFLDF